MKSRIGCGWFVGFLVGFICADKRWPKLRCSTQNKIHECRLQKYQNRMKTTSAHLSLCIWNEGIPGLGLWRLHYEDNSLNADYGSYRVHIQGKNLSERLPYYVLEVLQEVIVNAHLFDLFDDIHCHADKLWYCSK